MKIDLKDYRVLVAAILGIVAVEIMALATGHNGETLVLALSLIGGIGGYSIGLVDAPPGFKLTKVDDKK